MNDLLKKDLKIKIISILAAMLFWLYVYNVSDNPFQDTTLQIPLKIENEASLGNKDLVIKNKYKTSIDITVRGRQNALEKIRDSDFEAILDLSRVNSTSDTAVEIPEPYCTLKDVTIVSWNPNKIEIEVVKIKDNTFPIEITPNVTLKPGYKILKITPATETVTLEGEEAQIDSVDQIMGNLDLKDIDEDITKRVVLKVYSKDKKEILSLSKNLSVDVRVEVAREVPLNLVVTGTPNADYMEVSRSISPDKVRITGSPDALNAISALYTEPVSIDNIKQNLNTTGLIKLPNGIKLADQPKEVTVNITVEQLILKDFTIDKGEMIIGNTDSDGTLSYEIKTESINIQLKGRPSILNTLDIGDIRPTVDTSGLTEGTHKVPLNITLPNQVKLMAEAQVEVKVTKAQVTEGQ